MAHLPRFQWVQLKQLSLGVGGGVVVLRLADFVGGLAVFASEALLAAADGLIVGPGFDDADLAGAAGGAVGGAVGVGDLKGGELLKSHP
jgi:hypothetical protein